MVSCEESLEGSKGLNHVDSRSEKIPCRGTSNLKYRERQNEEKMLDQSRVVTETQTTVETGFYSEGGGKSWKVLSEGVA